MGESHRRQNQQPSYSHETLKQQNLITFPGSYRDLAILHASRKCPVAHPFKQSSEPDQRRLRADPAALH